MIWIILAVILVIGLWLYFKFFKIPKLKNVIFVDGSLGTGKSFYSVYIAIKLYKRAYRRYRIIKFLTKILSFIPKIKEVNRKLEEPLLFSNMPLRRVKFCNLTLDILERKKRIPYKSVILIDEISIVVDQFDYKDRAISDSLRDFFKLYRHETHGGYIVINSQSTADLHYSIKSVLSDYLYLHHKTTLPFVCAISVQEMAYSSDRDSFNITNANNQDLEENLKMILVPKRYFKRYDTYYLSILTDSLPVAEDWYVIDKKESAKVKKVLTYKKGRYDYD